MKAISKEERHLLAARAVRSRKWRAVADTAPVTSTIVIPLEKRFWDILDMGRTLLPVR